MSKIDEALKEKNARHPDGLVHRPGARPPGDRASSGELYAEKGYQYAEVKPTIKEMAGGPKLIHLTFNITEGPKVEIQRHRLRRQRRRCRTASLAKKMKENKGRGFFSFITGGGTYKEGKFEEDAEKDRRALPQRRLHRGAGRPARAEGARGLEATARRGYIQLRVPVTEGARYRVGDFKFEGKNVVKEEALRPLFKMKTGDWYAEKRIRKGMEKAREIFGSGGYYEFVGLSGSEAARPGQRQRQHERQTERRRGRRRDRHTERQPAPARRPSSTSRCGCSRASSTSSTGSPSSGTRRRATTSSGASCGCTRGACSTPRG